MKIIENHNNTRKFKNYILKSILERIDSWRSTTDWDGEWNKIPDPFYRPRKEWITVFPPYNPWGDIPKVDKKDSEKFSATFLKKYLKDYFGDYFIVSVGDIVSMNGNPDWENYYEIAIKIKDVKNYDYEQFYEVRRKIFLIIEDFLDSLIDEPYSIAEEKKILLQIIGRNYDNRLDKWGKTNLDLSSFNHKKNRGRIRIFKTLRGMEREGLVSSSRIFNSKIISDVSDNLDTSWKAVITPEDKFFRKWEKIRKEKEVVEGSDLLNIDSKAIKDLKVYEKKGKGYIKLGSKGKEILITSGRKRAEETRGYRLIQYLGDGSEKSIMETFEAIKIEKDEMDRQLISYGDKRQKRMLEIIRSTLKEIQSKIKGKIKSRVDKQRRTIKLYIYR